MTNLAKLQCYHQSMLLKIGENMHIAHMTLNLILRCETSKLLLGIILENCSDYDLQEVTLLR